MLQYAWRLRIAIEKDLFIKIENGRVIEQKVVDNTVAPAMKRPMESNDSIESGESNLDHTPRPRHCRPTCVHDWNSSDSVGRSVGTKRKETKCGDKVETR